jgi:prophage tail gpP-like protein
MTLMTVVVIQVHRAAMAAKEAGVRALVLVSSVLAAGGSTVGQQFLDAEEKAKVTTIAIDRYRPLLIITEGLILLISTR